MLKFAGGKQWVMGTLFTPGKNGFEVHAQAHLDRGIIGYTDIFGTSNLFDILAGPAFDALDVTHPDVQALWFALLNRGYRIAGTAFSDEHFRTYTQVPGDLTADRLMRAIANGQNMINQWASNLIIRLCRRTRQPIARRPQKTSNNSRLGSRKIRCIFDAH